MSILRRFTAAALCIVGAFAGAEDRRASPEALQLIRSSFQAVLRSARTGHLVAVDMQVVPVPHGLPTEVSSRVVLKFPQLTPEHAGYRLNDLTFERTMKQDGTLRETLVADLIDESGAKPGRYVVAHDDDRKHFAAFKLLFDEIFAGVSEISLGRCQSRLFDDQR